MLKKSFLTGFITFSILAFSYPSFVEGFLIITNGDGEEVGFLTKNFPVQYYIDPAGSDDINDGSEFNAIEASFQAWEDVSTSTLEFQRIFSGIPHTDQVDGKNLIIWTESKAGMDTGVIASTQTVFCLGKGPVGINNLTCEREGQILDADIVLNGGNFHFFTDTAGQNACDPPDVNNYMDIQNVITHEIGHFFGLGHPPESTKSGTTMYFNASCGETRKRNLMSDDEQGITHLYPVSSVTIGAPVIDAITPTTGTATETVDTTITGSNFNTDYLSVRLTRAPLNIQDTETRDYPATNISFPNNNTIVCSFDLTGKSNEVMNNSGSTVAALDGAYNLVAANTLGEETTLLNVFQVDTPQLPNANADSENITSPGLTGDNDEGGCCSTHPASGSPPSLKDLLPGIMLFFLPFLWIEFMKRLRRCQS